MMKKYHKIQTMFMRDPKTNHKHVIEGQWSKPEFEYLANLTWIITEKVDGTNIRVMWDGEKIRFGGKTDNAQIPTHLLAVLQDMFPIEKAREIFTGPICLYGEGYGPKIQKGGGNYRKDPSFVLFDALAGDMWFTRPKLQDIAEALGIDVVPILDVNSLYRAENMCANGFKSTWGDFAAEGIIAKPCEELFNRRGERVITKLKCKDINHK